MRIRLIWPALAILAALATAGCGGSSSTTGTGHRAATNANRAHGTGTSGLAGTGTATAPAPAATSNTVSTASASSAPQTANGAAAQCVASGLKLSYLGGQGATGHGLLGFAVRNTQRTSCHTFGYPGIQFIGRSGEPLPTHSTRTTGDFFGTTKLREVVVRPGHTASFRLGVTHGAVSTKNCTLAYGLQVIAPNDTATMRVAVPNGVLECAATTVSPMQPGTSAFP